ncbi:hypothetical protein E2C01_038426 [Portunus trituberculatus]|uniref:Uncharacterized protein n=1 Tax=Portunus trituberculatus TaxID=210409 RepID=A0A5B7FH76_PORTR|nr:hypothetical protein [Portunus trituberculatus]
MSCFFISALSRPCHMILNSYTVPLLNFYNVPSLPAVPQPPTLSRSFTLSSSSLYPCLVIDEISSLLAIETLLKTPLIISVALKNSRGERAKRFGIRTSSTFVM